MSVFKDYALYYDLLYKDKPYQEEADYVAKLLKEYAPKAKTLLELGVGTAKHASFLACDDYVIDGVDFSQAMLDIAQKHLSAQPAEVSKNITLHQGDVRTFKIDKTFDAAYSLFHVASYQISNQDLAAMFQTVKNHVAPGGVFIFDCWYGPAVLHEQPQVRFRQLQSDSLKVERVAMPTLNVNQNTVNVHYHLFIQDKNSDQYIKSEENHLMRYLFTPEIELHCAQHGMQLLSAQEWVTQKPLSENTWGACFIVRV